MYQEELDARAIAEEGSKFVCVLELLVNQVFLNIRIQAKIPKKHNQSLTNHKPTVAHAVVDALYIAF